MSSKKEMLEYQEKYGDISNNFFDRFNEMLDDLKITDKHLEKIRKGITDLRNASWTDIHFVFYFVPKATPRARLSPRTKTFYVRNASSNSQLFKEFIESHGHDFGIISTACKFDLDLFLPMPSGMSKEEKVLSELKLIYALSTPDWDNAGKTYSDMIQKYLLLNDSLICDGRVRKFYSMKPRIEMHIEYMNQYDCKFNMKKIQGWKFYKELEDKIEERDHIV